MIAIFSNPRPFKGEFYRIQINAILSWKRLPNVEIFLFDDEEGTVSEVCRELNINFVDEVSKNEFGTPLVGDCLLRVKQKTNATIIAQVNSDIILGKDFVTSLCAINVLMGNLPYYICGQRTNIKDYLTYQSTSEINDEDIISMKLSGIMHPPTGMDYWVFPSFLNITIPPFVAGRPGIDGWLVAYCKKNSIPVINATYAISALHQWHDYPAKKFSFFSIECDRNLNLSGGLENQLTVRESDFIYDNDLMIIKKPKGLRWALSYLSKFRFYGKILMLYRLFRKWKIK